MCKNVATWLLFEIGLARVLMVLFPLPWFVSFWEVLVVSVLCTAILWLLWGQSHIIVEDIGSKAMNIFKSRWEKNVSGKQTIRCFGFQAIFGSKWSKSTKSLITKIWNGSDARLKRVPDWSGSKGLQEWIRTSWSACPAPRMQRWFSMIVWSTF